MWKAEWRQFFPRRHFFLAGSPPSPPFHAQTQHNQPKHKTQPKELLSNILSTMTAEEEAKQLDSVTDRVQETELDASRSNKALSALNSSKSGATAFGSKHNPVKKEDVDVIVSELEVTEDEAAAALRAVAAEGSVSGDSLVTEALRRLVTS